MTWLKKHWLKVAVPVLILILFIGYRTYLKSDTYAYSQADNLFEKGMLESAISAFDDLGDFRDSEERIKSIEYEIATNIYESGELDLAASAFENLGDYNDASDRFNAIRYEIAGNLCDAESYLASASLFEELGSYSDAIERSREIRYHIAESYLRNGDLPNAASAFALLHGYLDSEERSISISYEHALNLYEQGGLRAASTIFRELGDYGDSRERYQALEWGLFRFTVDGNIITDHITSLQWKVGRDSTTTWFTARNWVASLGDGWRMPSRDELRIIYNAGVTESNWGPFDNSGRWVWTGEVREYAPHAYIFKFNVGNSGHSGQANPSSNYNHYRAFAVLSMEDTEEIQVSTIVPSPHSQRFQKSGEVITDSETGNEWRVAPDWDMNWYNARDWVNNLGGSWQMPSLEELLDLCEAGIETAEWGPFYNTGSSVWSKEQWWAREGDSNPSDGFYVNFYTGNDYKTSLNTTSFLGGYRAFAVRSP